METEEVPGTVDFVEEQAPEELSEQELRQLYDDEEVQRFLDLFASVSLTLARARRSSIS